MIASLAGRLQRVSGDSVIIDVAGVGYLVTVPLSTLQALPAPGETVTLLIHTHLREDALSLFGFSSELEKELFQVLMGVSGIGPKLALSILSGLPAEDLTAAIAGCDEARLSTVPGVGRKTAARICLELKDKVRLLIPAGHPAAPAAAAGGTDEDAVSALVNLGYKRPQAEETVRRVAQQRSGLPLGELIREALSEMRKR